MTSKQPAGGPTSRQDYLKKYLSHPQAEQGAHGKRKSKKQDKSSRTGAAKGLRLIEEDAFLPIPTLQRNRSPSSGEDNEEVIDQQRHLAASGKFKTDSFAAVQDELDTERPATNIRSAPTAKKKPIGSAKHRRESSVDSAGSDQSVTRRRPEGTIPEGDGDLSPVRHRPLDTRRRSPSPGDLSPPRRSEPQPRGEARQIKREVDSDEEMGETARVHGEGATASSEAQMSGGRKAGLVTTREMRDEAQRIREYNAKHMSTMEAGTSSGGDEVRRRETGFRRRDQDTKETEERKQREAERQAKLDEKYKSWNKGVAQLQEREQKLQEMEQTMKEGFARYADDAAMNEHLKEKVQDEDPMADYIRTKRHKVQMREGLVYPTYKGHWPPNRFGIPPGYRWDGVDRSNGFEAKIALAENKKRAQEEATYKSIMECED